MSPRIPNIIKFITPLIKTFINALIKVILKLIVTLKNCQKLILIYYIFKKA